MPKDSSIAAQRTPELPGLVKRGRPSTGKAKTNAQRQADFRRRKRFDHANPEYRLTTMLPSDAWYALGRIAFYYGVTKKEALVRMLIQAEESVFAELRSREIEPCSFALRDHFICSGKSQMTHPPRPDQARLDAVLATEADSSVTP